MAENLSTLEARLNAHRRLLVMILTQLSADTKYRSVLDVMLQENRSLSNYEEDPGVEPSTAFAMQSCTNGEVSSIIDDAVSRGRARV